MWKRGITREVILIGKFALKFPSVRGWWLFLEGLQRNMNETQREHCSEHFCPIVFRIPGGFLNVMKRCEPAINYDYDGMYDRFYKLNELHVENKECSFGILNDKLVAVDYG